MNVFQKFKHLCLYLQWDDSAFYIKNVKSFCMFICLCFRMFQPPPKGDNRPVLLMNKPTCSVPPAAQTPKPPAVTEVASAPGPAPVVQQGK